MTKAFKEGEAHWCIWTSNWRKSKFYCSKVLTMSNLGNDYYVQNFYDLPSYKKAIDRGHFTPRILEV